MQRRLCAFSFASSVGPSFPARVIFTTERLRLVALTTLVAVAMGASMPVHAETSQWSGFRGDGRSSTEQSGPDTLGGAKAEPSWQTSMPGQSVASVIAVDNLAVTSSSGGQDGERMYVTAVSVDDGSIAWQQEFEATGRPYSHPTGANAAPTAATDGQRLVAFFSSNDLVCLGKDGSLLWYRGMAVDHPKIGNDIGMASSPVIADGVVIIQMESQGDPMVVGIDLATGEDLWQMSRPARSNWSSPVSIDRPDGATEVVIQSGSDLVAVDPKTGEEKWRFDEGGSNISSATPTGDFLLVPGGEVMALDVGGSASRPEVVWRDNSLSPRNASLVVSGDRMYSLKGSVIVAAEIASGKTLWKQRLGGLGGTWATPLMAGKRLYVFDQQGKAMIVQDNGDEAEVVEETELPDGIYGSPAMIDDVLVVRGRRTLYGFR